jgi:hypothetical protein
VLAVGHAPFVYVAAGHAQQQQHFLAATWAVKTHVALGIVGYLRYSDGAWLNLVGAP